MRKAKIFFIFIFFQACILLVIYTHGQYSIFADRQLIQQKRELVRALELTDLCLFTEASYTRHFTQADRHTAFQDSPLALEHFPSGSILPPVRGGKR